MAGSAPVDSIGALRGNPRGRGKFDERLHFHTRRGPAGPAGPPGRLLPNPASSPRGRGLLALAVLFVAALALRVAVLDPGASATAREAGRPEAATSVPMPRADLENGSITLLALARRVVPGPVDPLPQSAGLPQALDPAIAATRRLAALLGAAAAVLLRWPRTASPDAPQRDRRGRVDGAFAVLHSPVGRLRSRPGCSVRRVRRAARLRALERAAERLARRGDGSLRGLAAARAERGRAARGRTLAARRDSRLRFAALAACLIAAAVALAAAAPGILAAAPFLPRGARGPRRPVDVAASRGLARTLAAAGWIACCARFAGAA